MTPESKGGQIQGHRPSRPSATLQQGRISRGIHELPKVSLRPAMLYRPNTLLPAGGHSLWLFKGWSPAGWAACGCLLPPWIQARKNSLKFHPGPPCPTLLHPAGRPPPKQPYIRFWSGPPAGRHTAVLYPLGYPTPYGPA
jgi:hypothetical protein